MKSLEHFDLVAGVCRILPFRVNLWAAQNAYSVGRRTRLQSEPAATDTKDRVRPQAVLDALGRKLGFRIEPVSEGVVAAE